VDKNDAQNCSNNSTVTVLDTVTASSTIWQPRIRATKATKVAATVNNVKDGTTAFHTLTAAALVLGRAVFKMTHSTDNTPAAKYRPTLTAAATLQRSLTAECRRHLRSAGRSA